MAQIYSQSNQTLVTTTFLGVRDTIMAEYKCTSPPSTIAMHRISAVKCKGKSPTYTEQTSEQTSTKSAPPKASSDVPSGAPKKKTRRGGKGKAKVHAIISSALVPPSVTNRMQETHHAVAPVAAPLSAPAMASTWVGGVKILKISKSHFAIGSDPIESKALHYHYLDLTYSSYLGRPRISSLSFGRLCPNRTTPIGSHDNRLLSSWMSHHEVYFCIHCHF